MADQNIWTGKVYYSGLVQGFSESYWIRNATDAATAKTKLAAVIAARKAMLSDEISIDYAHVSKLGSIRDSYMVGTGPDKGADTEVANRPNSLEDVIRIRQESLNGRICMRYMHGVPDAVVLNQQYVVGEVGAWDTLLAAYITALNTNTGFLNKVDPLDKTTWTVDAWGAIIQRGLGKRNVGAPFELHPGRRPVA